MRTRSQSIPKNRSRRSAICLVPSRRVRAICAAGLGVIVGLLAATLAEGAALAEEPAPAAGSTLPAPTQAAPAAPVPAEPAPPAPGPAPAVPAEQSAPPPSAVPSEATTSVAPNPQAPAPVAAATPGPAVSPLSEEEQEEKEEADEEARERQEELEEEEEERREMERCRKKAEQVEGPSALVGDRCKRTHFGGFGGPTVLGTQVDQKAALLLGIEAGLLINHRLSIGLAGYGLASEIQGPRFPNDASSVLAFGYGGVVGRYQFVTRGPIYASLGVLVGGGGITLLERREDDSLDFNDETKSANGFLVVEPSVQVHANLTHWMRLGLDGSYRFVHGVDYFDYKEKDFRGVAFGGHIQFGWF